MENQRQTSAAFQQPMVSPLQQQSMVSPLQQQSMVSPLQQQPMVSPLQQQAMTVDSLEQNMPPVSQPVHLPPFSAFSAISPMAPETFKRKLESPAKKINFPAARIKAIMRADDEVSMISLDAVLAMSAATELFLQELASASWRNTALDSRKTILYKDVAKAVDSTVGMEFLSDVS